MNKYTSFSITKAVDVMEDMGWCPLCGEASALDPENRKGECTNCCNTFCMQCNKKYHGSKRCENLMIDKKTLIKLGAKIDTTIKGNKLDR